MADGEQPAAMDVAREESAGSAPPNPGMPPLHPPNPMMMMMMMQHAMATGKPFMPPSMPPNMPPPFNAAFPPGFAPPMAPRPVLPGQPFPPAADPSVAAAAAAAAGGPGGAAVEAQSIGGGRKERVWVEYTTEEGEPYYYNTQTEETVWEKPEDYVEEESGEAQASAGDPVPVSWDVVPGTAWQRVVCNTGETYYHHMETNESSWSVPAEVIAAEEQRKKDMEKHGALLAVKRVLDVSQSAHDPLKRRKMHEWQDAGAGQSGQPPPSVPIREIYDPVTSVSPPRDGLHASRMGDKHSGAAEMEKRVADYHDLLKTLNLNPFSMWQREMPRMIDDPRFQMLPKKKRRPLFEEFIREHTSQLKEEKKKSKEEFESLLRESDLDYRTTLSEFEEDAGDDPRFRSVDDQQRREIFEEYLEPIREEHARTEKRAKRERREKEFLELLCETREIRATSDWRDIKPLIRHDRRYENVRHYEDREALFRKYIATLKSATAARREREREVEIRRERDHREAKRMLSEVQREENVNDLRSLFSECIKHPSMTWEEAQVLLKNRERFQSSQLSIRDKEELFHGHIKELLTRRDEAFRGLLMELGGKIGLTTELADVEDLMRNDGRYESYQSDARLRERAFLTYRDELISNARETLWGLLKESRSITVSTSGAGWDKALELLKADKRYKILDDLPEEREGLIAEYVEVNGKQEHAPPYKPAWRRELHDNDEHEEEGRSRGGRRDQRERHNGGRQRYEDEEDRDGGRRRDGRRDEERARDRRGERREHERRRSRDRDENHRGRPSDRDHEEERYRSRRR